MNVHCDHCLRYLIIRIWPLLLCVLSLVLRIWMQRVCHLQDSHVEYNNENSVRKASTSSTIHFTSVAKRPLASSICQIMLFHGFRKRRGLRFLLVNIPQSLLVFSLSSSISNRSPRLKVADNCWSETALSP